MFNKHEQPNIETIVANSTAEVLQCKTTDDDIRQIIVHIVMNICFIYCWVMAVYYVCKMNKKYEVLEQENGDIIEDIALSNVRMSSIANNNDLVEKQLHEFMYEMDTSIHRVKHKMKSMERSVKKIKKRHKRE